MYLIFGDQCQGGEEERAGSAGLPFKSMFARSGSSPIIIIINFSGRSNNKGTNSINSSVEMRHEKLKNLQNISTAFRATPKWQTTDNSGNG